MKVTNEVPLSSGSGRPTALTTPAVTLFSKSNGEPMAIAHWPGRIRAGSPKRTVGKPVAGILMSATSLRLSTPMTFARNSRRSVSLTVTSEASATTCALVST